MGFTGHVVESRFVGFFLVLKYRFLTDLLGPLWLFRILVWFSGFSSSASCIGFPKLGPCNIVDL